MSFFFFFTILASVSEAADTEAALIFPDADWL